MNKEERKIKLFELGRALSYTSDILEMRKEIKALKTELKSIEKERKDWEDNFNPTDIETAEVMLISQIREKLNQNETIIQRKIEEKKEKMVAYLGVVEGLCKYIFLDEDIELESNEIDINFIEEYIFILSEIMLDGKYIRFDEIFQDEEDFAKLVFKYYGDNSFKILAEILAYNHFMELFDYYFED